MSLSSQVGANAFVNIVGAIFAAIGIGLYAVDLTDASVVWMCNEDDTDNCRNVAFFAQVCISSSSIILLLLSRVLTRFFYHCESTFEM